MYHDDMFKTRPNFMCPKCQVEFIIGGKLDKSDYDGNGKSVISPIICHKCNEPVFPKRIEYVEETKDS